MDRFRSEIVGTAGLAMAAAAALILTWARRPRVGAVDDRRATTLFSLGLLFQTLHAMEEYSTRFYERFPPMLGLAPWSSEFFVVFNLTWLGVWAAAAFGLRAGYPPAFFPVWFFAIAAALNGIAHPLLSLGAGGYFPGLATSPLLGVVGVCLFVRLAAITESRHVRWREVGRFFETILFTIAVPGAVSYWIPREVFGLWGEIPRPGSWSVRQVAAIAPLSLGLAIYLRCLWEFAVRGHGIPAPVDHPKRLVVTGLYRYVRNPMYVGVLLFLLGESLFFGSLSFLVYTLGWLVFVHLNVLVYEEPNLRRKFGASYEHYAAAVHRWIPGKRYREAG